MTVYSFMIKFEGRKVMEIGREAEEVTIPPTVTRICEVACFFGSIASLDLEKTQITIIEKHAFANCFKLKEAKFSRCLEEICEGAFKNCKNLIHISFPTDSKLLKIGRSSFKDCSKLQKFDFPRLLEIIGDYSFYGCWETKIFDLRETKVRHIGRRSFHFEATVYLPSTVVQDDVINPADDHSYKIEVDESHPVIKRDMCGYYFSNGTIFQGNKEARRVFIRRGVERIAQGCFNESNLVSVTIPSTVTEISDFAFQLCRNLENICFTRDSQLRVIGKFGFFYCLLVKKIHLPKSLKIIKVAAFGSCSSLEQLVFPQDSQLLKIDSPFYINAIRRLSLPPSVREIVDVSNGLEKLNSMFVRNDFYQSNNTGSAIFSRDGSELVCVIKTLRHFEIPDCVRVIKKRAFYDSSITSLIIPRSVEVIEEIAFKRCANLKIIEFEEGSRLKSLAFHSFDELNDLIISNENFVKMENGVVMSLNPRGIVFVPRKLTEFEIPPGVEVIYSYAFNNSSITRLKFPKSLKKICSWAFSESSLYSIEFEEGTELDYIEEYSFYEASIPNLKLPLVKHLTGFSLLFDGKVIEFPPNFCLRNNEPKIRAKRIVCPISSFPTIAHFEYEKIKVLKLIS